MAIASILGCRYKGSERINSLEDIFRNPPMESRPYVWWHWMGSNFSKEGITKDLEAMKAEGMGGATIFNLASAVQESHYPTLNNPWPAQTYRSPAYWEALKHAAAEADRLGLEIGLHNTVGYSTTGGPWIGEERSMQRLVWSDTIFTGGTAIRVKLKKPVLVADEGWGKTGRKISFYRDVTMLAVPADKKKIKLSEVLNLSENFNAAGELNWNVPAGRWIVYRIGHASTGRPPHPVPDDLPGKVLEADKMSVEQSTWHWRNVLEPVKEHLGEYLGKSFRHMLIDSYEAGSQNWTPEFRDEFIRLKGYDPIPWLATFSQTVGTGKEDKDRRIVESEELTGRPEVSQYTEDPAFLKVSADKVFAQGINRMILHHWVHQPFDDKYQPGMGMGWWGTHFGRNQTWFEPGKVFYKYLARCQTMLQFGEQPADYLCVDKLQGFGDLISMKDFLSQNISVKNGKLVLPSRRSYFFLVFSDSLMLPETALKIKKLVVSGAVVVFRKQASTAEHPVSVTVSDSVVNWTVQQDKNGEILFFSPEQLTAKVLYSSGKEKTIQTEPKPSLEITGSWKVSFTPKLDEPFRVEFSELVDFSKHGDRKVNYFAGTATYHKDLDISSEFLAKNQKKMLCLGEMNDIAEVRINGKSAGVLWYPPYTREITGMLNMGKNTLEIAVTTNWANRLIGDEQEPADFKWGKDRGEKMGRAMLAYPDWFIKNEPRPSQGRKTFSVWYYYRKDSPLKPAGLVGPVRLVSESVIQL